MALATYGDLKTAVAAWMNRSDLTTVIPDFVTLAETDIRDDVRCPAMEVYATGTLTGETLAHPTRFIGVKSLMTGTENNIAHEYVIPERYFSLKNSGQAVYTSIGTNLYILDYATNANYSLTYWQSFAAFSAAGDTNYVLTNAPDIYLSATCRHGAAYMRDTEGEQRFAARYAAAVARFNRQQERLGYGNRLRVRVA